jgi:hypothetical protein
VPLAPWRASLCRGVDFLPLLFQRIAHRLGSNLHKLPHSFRFGLRLELLYFTTLLLNLLLRIELRPSLRLLRLLRLQLVADHKAAGGANRAVDRGTCAWRAHGTNYRAATRAKKSANARGLFTR